MCTKMIGVYFFFVYPILFLGIKSQGTCSTSWGSSCPPVTPLVSGPCPYGFDQVEEYCFKVSDEMVYWNESKHKCEEINAKLAEPRELLINSTVFANYLWQHRRHNLTYEDYEVSFSLGAQLQQFTYNSWEWLTGGNVSNYVYSYYGAECLSINVMEYNIEISRSEEFEIYFDLSSIACNSSAVPRLQRKYVYGTYRYVCQAPLVNNNYSTCEHNGKEYNSGQLVSMNEKHCKQNWCQDGIIQQYTCGNVTTGCCEYKSELFGDGDYIGPEVPTEDCSGCHQRICNAGVIQWQTCTNCSVQCCVFNGATYQPGSHIQNVCARLVCDGTTGQFIHQGIDYNCPKCKAYLDPHIVTYDQNWSSYSYMGCGNYSLSQIGSSYQPTLAIYATFIPCGGQTTLTCVGNVTFKNDEHTVITMGYKDYEYYIQVNGDDYAVPSYSPSIVQVMNTVYPVLAWKGGYNCVNLQGSSGILVRYCGSRWSNQAYVWADLDVAGGLKGLCGTVNDDVDDDFSTRDGTITSPWQRNPSEEFPLSWLASVTSNGSCYTRAVSIKRQAQNNCEVDPSNLDEFYYQCESAVINSLSDSEPEEVQTLIDDCVYDLCNVSNPAQWIQEVWQTAYVQGEIQKTTLNFTTPTTTPAPTTVEPNTDCKCTSKCWKKSGYCTKDPESCDGRVKNRGCDGPGCVCCLPKGCRPKMKCRRKGGFCTSAENCSNEGGVTINGCWGRGCICCLKSGRCNPKKKCWNKSGFCVTDPSNCKGKIINNGCRSKNCYCCINEPKC